jgi:hypothetical protein
MIKKVLKVGCFGALRPFKNHCQQALLAIEFANRINKILEFHINVNEKDNDNAVLQNLRAIFADSPHKLIEHPWLPHYRFLNLVSNMDIGMQLSFTETFNIVAADFVHCNIPIVVSKEISWIHWLFKANMSSKKSVFLKMYIAYYGRLFNLQRFNSKKLKKYNIKSINIWMKYILDCNNSV